MRDTTQVRAMDDYFHSLLLDDALLLDSSDEPDSAPSSSCSVSPSRLPIRWRNPIWKRISGWSS